MKSFFSDMKKIISDPRCLIPVAATALLSYGWQMFRFNIGIDDVVRSRYLGGGLFSQGRFSSTLVSYMFGQYKAMPFFEPFLATVFLTFSAFLLILLFMRASKGAFSRTALTFMACLFVSYPLINELFVYKGSELYMGIGYMLCAVSLLTVSGIFRKTDISGGSFDQCEPSPESAAADTKKRRRSIMLRLVSSTLIWIFLASLYEAFAAVYLVLASLYVFTEIYFGQKRIKDLPGKNDGTFYIRKFFICSAPMAAGVLIEFAAGLIITKLVDFGTAIPAGSGIYIPEEINAEYFVNILYSIFRRFFLAGLWYVPVLLFAICAVISLILFIVTGIVKRRASVILCAAGTLAGLFGLAVLTGGSIKYRTCLSFAPFVAYVIALLVHKARRLPGKRFSARRIVSFVGAAALVIVQTVSINLCFYDNDVRWKEDKALLTLCGEALKNDGRFDTDEMPVIFIGDYRMSDNVLSRKYVRADDPVYKAVKKAAVSLGFSLDTTDLDDQYVIATCQSDFGSVIGWGIHDKYSCNEELLLIFKELGYEFKPGTAERYEELSEELESFPVFNETGEVTVLSDCVVVRFK